jgi:nucleoid DNA-binding protein
MEELVQQVSQRAGISEEQARTAVETVAEILKERIPSPYNKYVDSFLTGEGGGLGGMLGGLFGGK